MLNRCGHGSYGVSFITDAVAGVLQQGWQLVRGLVIPRVLCACREMLSRSLRQTGHECWMVSPDSRSAPAG